ncbi:MAG TPA: hypothetical protein VMY42_16190 [Thermoguttaceae bacterium]|nr:hypothetical protein [Thermoguttaceae bacterium]
MKLVSINLQPTDRQLRQFGWISLVALPFLGWFWSGGNMTVIAVAAAVGAVLAVGGLLCPRAIRPIFVGLTLIAVPIGMVISELALLLVFYGMFVPMGLFFRLVGRDPLQRNLDRQADTYWQPKKQPADSASYLRQW